MRPVATLQKRSFPFLGVPIWMAGDARQSTACRIVIRRSKAATVKQGLMRKGLFLSCAPSIILATPVLRLDGAAVLRVFRVY
jgi:hypothetical protein